MHSYCNLTTATDDFLKARRDWLLRVADDLNDEAAEIDAEIRRRADLQQRQFALKLRMNAALNELGLNVPAYVWSEFHASVHDYP